MKLSKGFIGLSVIPYIVIALGVGGVLWYVKGAIDERAQLRNDVKVAQSINFKNLQTIAALQREAQVRKDTLAQREAQNAELAESIRLMKRGITEIKRDNPDVENYLNQRIPPALLERLRETERAEGVGGSVRPPA